MAENIFVLHSASYAMGLVTALRGMLEKYFIYVNTDIINMYQDVACSALKSVCTYASGSDGMNVPA